MPKEFVPWFMTRSGQHFVPSDPRPEAISIFDVATALSRMPRYAGHTVPPISYSVAQHSCHVSDLLEPRYKLWGLLHDAAEAYVMDMPYAAKCLLPEYRALEDRIMLVIAKRFRLDPLVEPPEVKVADRAVASAEKVQLMPSYRGDDWHRDGMPSAPDVDVYPWYAIKAEQEFLGRFFALTPKMETDL